MRVCNSLSKWLSYVFRSRQLRFLLVVLILFFFMLTNGICNFAKENELKLSLHAFSFIQNDTRGQIVILLGFALCFSDLYSGFRLEGEKGAGLALSKLLICIFSALLYLLAVWLIAQLCIIGVSVLKINSYEGWSKISGAELAKLNPLFLPDMTVMKNYSAKDLFVHSVVFEFALLLSLSLIFINAFEIAKKTFAVMLMIGIIFSDILFFNLFTANFRRLSIVTLSMLSSLNERDFSCGFSIAFATQVFLLLLLALILILFLRHAFLIKHKQD